MSRRRGAGRRLLPGASVKQTSTGNLSPSSRLSRLFGYAACGQSIKLRQTLRRGFRCIYATSTAVLQTLSSSQEGRFFSSVLTTVHPLTALPIACYSQWRHPSLPSISSPCSTSLVYTVKELFLIPFYGLHYLDYVSACPLVSTVLIIHMTKYSQQLSWLRLYRHEEDAQEIHRRVRTHSRSTRRTLRALGRWLLFRVPLWTGACERLRHAAIERLPRGLRCLHALSLLSTLT